MVCANFSIWELENLKINPTTTTMFFGGDDGLAWTPSPSILGIKSRSLKKTKKVTRASDPRPTPNGSFEDLRATAPGSTRDKAPGSTPRQRGLAAELRA